MVALAHATTSCVIAFASIIAAGALAQSRQETAYVHIELAKRYIGGDGGSGALFFKGRHRYRLVLSGIELGAIGREVDLAGKVINLQTPADIQGTYRPETGVSAIVGGSRIVRMQNEKGVILELHAQAPGSSLNLAGMTIAGRGF
jgi:hypothetical protein